MMMNLFTIQYANLLFLLLSTVLDLPACAAASGSAIARSSRSRPLAGFGILSDEFTHDFVRRQTECPLAAPYSCRATCCATPCCGQNCCSQGTTCSAGQCVPNTPPPSATVIPPSSSRPPPSSASSTLDPTTPGSSSAVSVSPDPPVSVSEIPSSTASSGPSSASSTPTPSTSGPSSAVPGSVSDPLPQSSIASGPSSGGSESAGTNSTDLGLAPSQSESVTSDTVNSTLSGTATTGDFNTTGGPIPSPTDSASDGLGQNDTSSVSYSLSYQYGTVTGADGSESISIGSVSFSELVPVTAGPAPSAAPLVVQVATPDAPPTPVLQLNYLPGDCWDTTGSESGSVATTTTDTGRPSPRPVGLCNNGTKVSNKVGSQIRLKFTGTEVSLLMVPGITGGSYDIKLDGEDVETLDNYKADGTSCEVAAPWSRSGLANKPHDITVIVKGSRAGSFGGSQVEFSGLIFKGPKPAGTTTEESAGPNKWIIVGVSIGGGILVIALITILVICIRRRRAQRAAPTPDPRPPSAVSSFRPQTTVSGHTRADSTFSGGIQVGHRRGDSNLSNGPNGHYRSDSGLSGGPYSPTSPHQTLQNPFGHARQQSDAPLMTQQHEQLAPWMQQGWQSPHPAATHVSSASPYHSNMSSPRARPATLVGYGNGQERQSYVQSHGRTTSYGSDGRNPFE